MSDDFIKRGTSDPDNAFSDNRRDFISLQAVLRTDPQLFVDVTGEPRIHLPLISCDSEQVAYPLRHRRVRCEIANVVFEETEIIPFEQEISRLINILEARAWKNQVHDVCLLDAMDEDPLVEAVFILLNQSEVNGRFEGSCTELLSALSIAGRKFGVDVQSKVFPKGAAQLSSRLGELAGKFENWKIRVKRGRRPGGARFVSLHKTDSCDDGPSAASHVEVRSNSPSPKDLSGSDARDTSTCGIFDAIRFHPKDTP